MLSYSEKSPGANAQGRAQGKGASSSSDPSGSGEVLVQSSLRLAG